MRANWFGLAGERLKNVFGRISTSEVISGIPGAATEHYGVPFSLTEEFAAVYRMHPLVPDDWSIRALADDQTLGDYTLRDFSGPERHGGARQDLDAGPVLLVRHPAPRAGQPAQLPAVPAGVRAARRQADGPRGDRHPAAPRDGRAALLRVPPPAAPRRADDVRRAHDATAATAAKMRRAVRRRHRAPRPDGRAVRRGQAGRASPSATRRSASSS